MADVSAMRISMTRRRITVSYSLRLSSSMEANFPSSESLRPVSWPSARPAVVLEFVRNASHMAQRAVIIAQPSVVPAPGSRSTAGVRASASSSFQPVQDSSPHTGYREVADHETILQLADFYYRVVYPILLYFHWPTFSQNLCAKRYSHDRSLYALTMAVCATASARIQEKAPLPPSSLNLNFASIPPSKVFYQECMDTLNQLKEVGPDFNIMRTEALLGMLDLQYNDLGGCLGHLHRYLAMSAETGFHDEANWPSTLTEIEVQERRRLFWQCYHFDVYLAVTFGCPMRQRESYCCVRYPTEVYDDEEITETGIAPITNGAVSFIRGWNFVTDLYRVLEHMNELWRARETDVTRPGSNLGLLFANLNANRDRVSENDMLLTAQQDWESLPTELKTARPMTGDIIGDRYGFQAANIIITMTTVKMVLTRSEDHTLAQRCAMAGELLDNLSSIPTIYVQATSTAMLHHLAGVGHLLGSITHSPLSPWMYLQVRSAILAMADLIDSLQAALTPDVNISLKLREHVEQTDRAMEEVRKTNTKNHVLHSALPAGVSCIAEKTPSQEDDQDVAVRTLLTSVFQTPIILTQRILTPDHYNLPLYTPHPECQPPQHHGHLDLRRRLFNSQRMLLKNGPEILGAEVHSIILVTLA
ncbi:conserved hypothetical protein [Talaromyces stipitatus ATCC 10500]|uniref:Xylanolytic transcriptional activator regulatory domain-containing protein n=1 Tax=Talaromyces stipitatus (strain ATCC 10500 / CBS 375.48 / QM 6759 / NRRL 1006) TaxID=441959 RepID=B8MMF3_TALSN|nr:uncharacterized protein TSTA_099580 [Talaromyces stipitatus ATCC 10500]EED13706.1 conserved hypothetical protein [Talaromyces stipitatus ATCC 10500]